MKNLFSLIILLSILSCSSNNDLPDEKWDLIAKTVGNSTQPAITDNIEKISYQFNGNGNFSKLIHNLDTTIVLKGKFELDKKYYLLSFDNSSPFIENCNNSTNERMFLFHSDSLKNMSTSECDKSSSVFIRSN